MENVQSVIRMYGRKHSCAYVMNVTSVLTEGGALSAVHLESPMHITVLNVRDWKRIETGVPRS